MQTLNRYLDDIIDKLVFEILHYSLEEESCVELCTTHLEQSTFREKKDQRTQGNS